MPKLAFVIPTWNRSQHIIKCVDSIAQQADGRDDVVIHIVQDGSEHATTESIEYLTKNWPIVKTTRHEPHTDYAAAFRTMFRVEHEADWVWTFGDDDYLRPGALKFILGQLDERKAHFIHVSEAKRGSGTNNVYSASTMLDLCNEFGWIEMTGFITGNITRGFYLSLAADSTHWRTYAKSAFVQSCALLEVLKDRPAMFMDVPLIDSQEKEQTNDTAMIWRDQNIPGRYLFVVDAIECMMENEILTHRVKPKFFRYLTYHLWDRFLVSFLSDFLNQGMLWPDEAWSRIMRFAQLIDDEDVAKQLIADVEAARGLSSLANYLQQNANGMRNELTDIFNRRGTQLYPYSFTPRVSIPAAPDSQPDTASEPTPAA